MESPYKTYGSRFRIYCCHTALANQELTLYSFPSRNLHLKGGKWFSEYSQEKAGTEALCSNFGVEGAGQYLFQNSSVERMLPEILKRMKSAFI